MDHQTINQAIARLSLVATEDVPPRATLAELCDLAAQVLEVDGVGVMVTDAERNRYVHATTVPAETMERTQEVLRSGPCRDAARTTLLVTAVGEREIDRWAGFAEVAADVGIGAMAAVPLVSRGRCWGVLDLYRQRPVQWGEDELAAAQLLASVATAHLVMAHDRDTSRLAQTQLAHVSSHDPLTGLPNRVLLMDRLTHALESAPRRGCAVGVIFTDLDHFKNVNDTYGHRIGDAVLRETARRLSGAVRDNDTVGRLAGDEFVIICEELPIGPPEQPRQALDVIAARVLDAMAPRIELDVGEIAVTLSLGAAAASEQMTAEDLVHEADIAMYQAKQDTHRRLLSLRDYTTWRTLGQARVVDQDLRSALRRDEFEVHYQPIVHAEEPDRVAAVESLLRWRGRDEVIIAAREFIDVAVEHGLMPAIGGWVIDQVCAQMARWTDELGDRAPAVAYVNLSAREITDPSLPGTLASACLRHRIPPDRIGLEIVEDNFVHPNLTARLAELRDVGHPLSIDDFGTGYSSVSRLLEVSVDVAKIDQTFVAGSPADPRRAGFIDAAVSIARSLGIDVIAEGVETVEQREFLARAGCTYLQGHLFGHPEPGDVLTARLLSPHPVRPSTENG